MIIDLKGMEAETFKNFKGGEKEIAAKMFFDGKNRIMHGTILKGASIGLHTHTDNCEIVYALSGKAKILFDDGVEYLSAGQSHYCPKGHAHSMINESDEPFVFFAAVPEQK